MRIAYFDCFSGASGDMILGALVDAGWPAVELKATLALLGIPGWQVAVTPVVKQGLSAVQVSFDIAEPPRARSLGELLSIVLTSALPEGIKADSLRVLRRLGRAEAEVHGLHVPLEDVHLHELGSLDTLFDVVGALAGLTALGISTVHVSPLNLGGGTVQTAHGRLPVPAPAVAALVRGLPVYGGTQADGELLTPTGAALLGTVGSEFGALPRMTVEKIGAGAGKKEGRLPNLVRLWVGESPTDDLADQVVLLETNIDDMIPELYGSLVDRLLAAGALDVTLTPVIMKKGRPGTIVGVLCAPERSNALEDLIFRETTSFGIRSTLLTRRKLARKEVVVPTLFGSVRVKVGQRNSETITVSPEFEDCRRAAETAGVPVKVVYDAAYQGFFQQNQE